MDILSIFKKKRCYNDYAHIESGASTVEYKGKVYDLEIAMKRNFQSIRTEARNHKDSSKYNLKDIIPTNIRFFHHSSGDVMYCMICYEVPYISKSDQKFGRTRLACGNYYPIYEPEGGKCIVSPHAYQGSVCW